MPKIPTYDSFQVTPNAPSTQQFATPAMATAQNATAQQLANTSQAVSNAGNLAAKMAVDIHDTANQLRVDDALNQAKELATRLTYDKDTGYTTQRGINALERQSGKPLADEYGEKLQFSLSDITKGLGNDAQRMAFSQKSAQLLTSFKTQAMAHESSEFVNYRTSVREGTISNATNRIGLNYNNPNVVSDEILSIKAAVVDLATLGGKSAEWLESKTRDLTSAAHMTAISAALEKNDPVYAKGYLAQYKGDMSAPDILKVNGLITKEMDTKLAMGVARQVMDAELPSIVNSDHDRAFTILIGTESGGRQMGADKKPLTSSAGAIGIAQVMPDTAPEAAKLAGLKYDEQRYKTDLEYNKALGRAYFDKQIKDFDGNLSYAYAAYNAGPGATRRALDKAKADGSDWLGNLPKETQDYVSKNMLAYTTGGGKGVRRSLGELQAAAREALGPDATPEQIKQARDQVKVLFDETDSAIKAQEENALAQAYKALNDNGGNFAALPTSIRESVPSEKMDDLMKHADTIRKGQEPETNPAVYYGLSIDEDKLRTTNLLAIRGQLNNADYQRLVEKQSTLFKGGDTGTRSKKDLFNNFIQEMGLEVSPKKEADAKATGNMWRRLEDMEYEFRAEKGRSPTTSELRQILGNAKADMVIETVGLNSEKPFIALTDEEMADAYVEVGFKGKATEVRLSAIPDFYRADAMRRISSKGLQATQSLIAQMWLEDGQPKK